MSQAIRNQIVSSVKLIPIMNIFSFILSFVVAIIAYLVYTSYVNTYSSIVIKPDKRYDYIIGKLLSKIPFTGIQSKYYIFGACRFILAILK